MTKQKRRTPTRMKVRYKSRRTRWKRERRRSRRRKRRSKSRLASRVKAPPLTWTGPWDRYQCNNILRLRLQCSRSRHMSGHSSRSSSSSSISQRNSNHCSNRFSNRCSPWNLLQAALRRLSATCRKPRRPLYVRQLKTEMLRWHHANAGSMNSHGPKKKRSRGGLCGSAVFGNWCKRPQLYERLRQAGKSRSWQTQNKQLLQLTVLPTQRR
mmetsp:Transcript_48225/g.95875  ORF Transcript_48225/g.95875 Transcript_48225/m.95875 type:complete len:211 (+) Transcript_48225:293-925(+)